MTEIDTVAYNTMIKDCASTSVLSAVGRALSLQRHMEREKSCDSDVFGATQIVHVRDAIR